MKSEAITKLPLPRFAQLLGIQPQHFMGVQFDDIQNGSCGVAWMQHEWQTADGVSREEVAGAIAQAEADIENALHYRLLPSWEEAERVQTIRSRYPEAVLIGPYGDMRGHAPAVETKWKHVIAGGRRAKVLVEAGAALTYANTGIAPAAWLDTATVQVTVADGVLECELAVFMPGYAGDDRYRVRPIVADIIGNTATITFRRELGIDPAWQETYGVGGEYIRPVDGLASDHFVETVDVYRIYNSGETQVALIWQPPYGCACGGTGACVYCREAMQPGCLVVQDGKMGQVGYMPGTWDAETATFSAAQQSFGYRPRAVELYYYAGLRDLSLTCPNHEMSRQWERTVAILAATRLGRSLCACNTSKAFADYYQRNAAFAPGDGSSYQIERDDLGNPFGSRVGEIAAWKMTSRPGARVAHSA